MNHTQRRKISQPLSLKTAAHSWQSVVSLFEALPSERPQGSYKFAFKAAERNLRAVILGLAHSLSADSLYDELP